MFETMLSVSFPTKSDICSREVMDMKDLIIYAHILYVPSAEDLSTKKTEAQRCVRLAAVS